LPDESDLPNEPMVITGVVHPLGTGALVNIGKEKPLTLRFNFESWRGEDHVLHTEKLPIFRDVTREEYDWYREQIHPYGILTVRVVITKSNWAELLEIWDQPITPDDPLVHRVAELQKPKTYQHELFGTLTLNRSFDQYETTTVWADKEVELALSANDDTSLATVLQVAVELWNNQATWKQRIEDYAVQELLDLKNEVWIDENEEETQLTPEVFKSRMTLQAIVIHDDAEFEFWHDDGDLFFGHSILIRGNMQDGPNDADTPG
jgi:hypothetical protein